MGIRTRDQFLQKNRTRDQFLRSQSLRSIHPPPHLLCQWPFFFIYCERPHTNSYATIQRFIQRDFLRSKNLTSCPDQAAPTVRVAFGCPDQLGCAWWGFGLEMGIVLGLFWGIVLVLFGVWRQIAKNDLGYDGQKSLGK